MFTYVIFHHCCTEIIHKILETQHRLSVMVSFNALPVLIQCRLLGWRTSVRDCLHWSGIYKCLCASISLWGP